MADDNGLDPRHTLVDEADATQHMELLYREQASVLRRRVRAKVGSADEAGELVQEAFARLLGVSSAHSLRNSAAFLNRIVRNLLIDHYRRNRKVSHVPLTDGFEVAIASDQDRVCELSEMRERCRELIAELPPRTRQVFMLHRFGELRHREIANHLDISIRTVEWHVAQATLRLAAGLVAY